MLRHTPVDVLNPIMRATPTPAIIMLIGSSHTMFLMSVPNSVKPSMSPRNPPINSNKPMTVPVILIVFRTQRFYSENPLASSAYAWFLGATVDQIEGYAGRLGTGRRPRFTGQPTTYIIAASPKTRPGKPSPRTGRLSRHLTRHLTRDRPGTPRDTPAGRAGLGQGGARTAPLLFSR